MAAQDFKETLSQENVEIEGFLKWFAQEFEIWQNIGAFDSTVLGFNKDEDIVYRPMYKDVWDYIEDKAFDASVLSLHVQDFKDQTGRVNDEAYHRYLKFDREVVAKPVSLDNIVTYFPFKNEGAEQFAKQRVRAVKMWLDRETNLGGALVREMTGSSGKNNRGIFRVEADRRYIVKVVNESAVSQFQGLGKLNTSFTKLQDPDLPRIARIVDWGQVGGVAMGLFEEAPGKSLDDLHQSWAEGERTDEELTGIYGSVGSSLGAFNLSGVSASGSKSKKLAASARTHGDPNPSNLFVDVNDGNRTTLIDNEGVNLETARVDAVPFELNAHLWNFNEKTFRVAGEARKSEALLAPFALTKPEKRVQSELRMFHAFARGYAAKAPESIKDYVIAQLQSFLDKYLNWYVKAAQVPVETAKEWIPEFGQKIG